MLFTIKIFFYFSILILMINGCSNNRHIFSYSSYTKKPKSSVAMHRSTMRSYRINGKTYYPTVVKIGEKYRGIASWYGPNFHGKKTSNGEYYNMYGLTAAHKTLPMNTMVKVTNLENGKSAVVRINDRGPFIKNRIIDLSYAAAKKIDMISKGTALVELEVLGFDKIVSSLMPQTSKEIEVSNFGVQIASFRRYEGAKITKDKYSLVDGRYKAIIKKFIVDGKPLYRVWLMGFKSEAEARDFIASNRFLGAFIVRE